MLQVFLAADSTMNMLPPALKPACSYAMISLACGLGSVLDDNRAR